VTHDQKYDRQPSAMQTLWHHPWVVAACNILLILAVYPLSRLFFYLTAGDLFPDVTPAHLAEMMGGGVRFDLTAVLYLSSVYLVLMLIPFRFRERPAYRTAARWFFLVPNIIGVIVNSIDMVYARFSDRRTTITFFSEFGNDNNLLRIAAEGMVQYWYVSVFCIAMLILLVLLTRSGAKTQSPARNAVYYPVETALLCISVYFTIIGMRGGFGAYTRPITLSNALQYTDRPRETLLVLNTPFSIMRSTEGSVYHNPHYFPEAELARHMTPEHGNGQVIPHKLGRYNVVIVILESFSKEYTGYFNRHLDGGAYSGYTPFLDSLLANSITYTRSFASGRKSIDAMPSVLSSIPMLIEPYVVTPYSTNTISSLAACLKKKGYTTAFFHGAPNGSMGFQAYARSAGFDAYYGMDEYRHFCRQNGRDAEADFDGTWAIWDEEFLRYMAHTTGTMQEPFLTAVFTASSHHPFHVPARYEGMFPEGTQPIHRCIGYSDMALRRYFDFASRQPWFDNTLFVLTADHTNQTSHLEYATAKGLYEVPIAFYMHGWQDRRTDSTTVISQTDIMPSVLAALGYDEPFFAFGENALTQRKTHPYAVCYNNPVFQIMSDSLLVQFDGSMVTAVFNYNNDPLLRHRLPVEHVPADMIAYLKAYIQQYIARMTENRLTITGNP